MTWFRSIVASGVLLLSARAAADSLTMHIETMGGVDTFVQSSAPDSSFSGQTDFKNGGSGDESRALLRFSTARFPLNTTRVRLYLYCDGSNGGQNVAQTLHRVTSDWDNTVTWTAQPITMQISTLSTVPAPGQWLEIDITQVAKAWMVGEPNDGIELRATGTSNQSNSFASLESSDPSLRPYLVLDDAPIDPALDSDLDGLPDAWEQAYGLDPTVPNFDVGTRSDGSFTVAQGQNAFVNDTLAVLSAVQSAGSTKLTGTFPPGLQKGDVLLLHITQSGTPAVGSPAGTFELVQIAAVGTGQVMLKNPLENTYDPSTGAKIQCMRVPQYDQLRVDGAISARSWNGTSGGIVAVIANDVVVSATGTISASGSGYRGGAPSSTVNTDGFPGESTIAKAWPLSRSTSANGSGGGGGGHGDGKFGPNGIGNGGGGGAYGTNGTGGSAFNFDLDGTQPTSSTGGAGGSSTGQPAMTQLFFGGGGGAGGVDKNPQGQSNDGGAGGNGGGIVIVVARSVQNDGRIASDGGAGDGYIFFSERKSPGGGGAGGSVYVASMIKGAGQITANAGATGDTTPNHNGTAGVGRVRFDKRGVTSVSGIQTPAAYQGDFWNGNIPPINILYQDHDSDGLTDLQEYLFGTSPILADTDGDGLPDVWEVKFGTNPTVPDANADPDGDGLTNLMEFQLGTNPNSRDSDGDGISDYDEVFVYGTNPLNPDTDGDGMPDGWEIAHGLNPRVNDANDDADQDGLTNLEEYRAGTDPQSAYTNGSIISDYQKVKGGLKRTSIYDANDRLLAVEYSNGTALVYAYDGNGSLVRQYTTATDADHDGLPDVWEQTYGLSTSSATGDDGPWGDPDHDGYTNYQEWMAGTNPRDPNSHPNPLTTPASMYRETPTLAQIIPASSTLGALPTLTTRLWDNEGNSAQVVVQYFDPTTQQWKNATLTTLDSAAYSNSSTVAALPTGSNHSLVWNAYADLGSTFNGTVQLRVQGNDPFLAGAWSTPLTVSVNMNTATNSGVPDAWAMQHGLNINGASFATTDADHDGLSDLLEYALNTDPNQSNANPVTVSQDTGNHLTITYIRRTDAPQLSYIVEVSHDLVTWTSGNQFTVEVSAVDQGNNTQLVTTRSVDTASSTSGLFMRLRITVSSP